VTVIPTTAFATVCTCVASPLAQSPSFEVYHTSTTQSAVSLKAIALFAQVSAQVSPYLAVGRCFHTSIFAVTVTSRLADSIELTKSNSYFKAFPLQLSLAKRDVGFSLGDFRRLIYTDRFRGLSVEACSRIAHIGAGSGLVIGCGVSGFGPSSAAVDREGIWCGRVEIPALLCGSVRRAEVGVVTRLT